MRLPQYYYTTLLQWNQNNTVINFKYNFTICQGIKIRRRDQSPPIVVVPVGESGGEKWGDKLQDHSGGSAGSPQFRCRIHHVLAPEWSCTYSQHRITQSQALEWSCANRRCRIIPVLVQDRSYTGTRVILHWLLAQKTRVTTNCI